MRPMKPHDKRRLNKFILDEMRASKEYNQMGIFMEENGFFEDAAMFYGMAEDEAGHAEAVRDMIRNLP